MCGHTHRYMIRNEVWEKVRVVSVADKMVETKLRWFVHVNMRCEDVSVRCGRLAVVGVRRGKGKAKKNWKGD